MKTAGRSVNRPSGCLSSVPTASEGGGGVEGEPSGFPTLRRAKRIKAAFRRPKVGKGKDIFPLSYAACQRSHALRDFFDKLQQPDGL